MIPEPVSQRSSDISWSRPQDWRTLLTAVKRSVCHEPRLKSARNLAADIRRELSGIFPVLDGLCQRSCPWCPDPCCLNARLWFDIKDILFLLLTDQEMPDQQPCSHRNQPCRYLGGRGCRLPRLRRPFTCTWYMCPTQKAILRQEGDLPAEKLLSGIERIKAMRKQLVSETGTEKFFYRPP